MSSAHKPLTKDEMLAAFPEACPKVIGQPTMRELIRVLMHMILCSQSCDYALSNCNFLFVCVPDWLYGLYTQEPYPNRVANPGPSPVFSINGTPAQHANEKSAWELNNKYYVEPRTMDSALITRFTSLFDEQFKRGFVKRYISNPKMTFRECFDWFYDAYGKYDEHDIAENEQRMKKPWSMHDGWEILEDQIEEAWIYSMYCQNEIADKAAVNIAMKLILDTGIFAHEYEQWTARDEAEKTWAGMKAFWPAKIDLKKTTSTTMAKQGFGMSAAEADDFAAAAANFSEAHNAAQSSFNHLTTSNATMSNVLPAIQQQMQQQNAVLGMLCQQVANNAWNNNGGNNNSNNNGGGGGGRRNNNRSNRWNRNNRNNNGGGGGGGGGGGNNNRNNNSNSNGGPTAQQRKTWPYNVRRYALMLDGQPSYCHTHGCDTGPHHTSMTCNRRGNNHNAMATFNNKMGGSTANSERTIDPKTLGLPYWQPPAEWLQQQTQQFAASMMQQAMFQQPAVQQPAFQPAPFQMPMQQMQQQFAGMGLQMPQQQQWPYGMPIFASGATQHFMPQGRFM